MACCSTSSSAPAAPLLAQALLRRINSLEERLEGAENLGGVGRTVEDIAGILGLTVHQARRRGRTARECGMFCCIAILFPARE